MEEEEGGIPPPSVSRAAPRRSSGRTEERRRQWDIRKTPTRSFVLFRSLVGYATSFVGDLDNQTTKRHAGEGARESFARSGFLPRRHRRRRRTQKKKRRRDERKCICGGGDGECLAPSPWRPPIMAYSNVL